MTAVTAYSRSVVNSLPSQYQAQAEGWLTSKDASKAKDLVALLRPCIYPKSQTRYRFAVVNPQEAAAKAVFDAAFQEAPDRVIADAEAAAETSFYPLWKRVSRIYLPRVIGTIAGNTIVKIMLIMATGCFGYTAGYKAYATTQHFIAAQAVPYIINNTPIEVIRVLNTAMGYLNHAAHWIGIWVLLAWIVRKIILVVAPEIPYFTPLVRAIHLGTLFWILVHPPQTIGLFLLERFVVAGMFVWESCDDVSQFFLHMAEKAEAGKLDVSQPKAYALWVRDLSCSACLNKL